MDRVSVGIRDSSASARAQFAEGQRHRAAAFADCLYLSLLQGLQTILAALQELLTVKQWPVIDKQRSPTTEQWRVTVKQRRVTVKQWLLAIAQLALTLMQQR